MLEESFVSSHLLWIGSTACWSLQDHCPRQKTSCFHSLASEMSHSIWRNKIQVLIIKDAKSFHLFLPTAPCSWWTFASSLGTFLDSISRSWTFLRLDIKTSLADLSFCSRLFLEIQKKNQSFHHLLSQTHLFSLSWAMLFSDSLSRVFVPEILFRVCLSSNSLDLRSVWVVSRAVWAASRLHLNM